MWVFTNVCVVITMAKYLYILKLCICAVFILQMMMIILVVVCRFGKLLAMFWFCAILEFEIRTMADIYVNIKRKKRRMVSIMLIRWDDHWF